MAARSASRCAERRFEPLSNGLAPACTCKRGRTQCWLFYLPLAERLRAWFEGRSSPSLARTQTARTQRLPEAPTECVGSAQRQRDRQQRRTPASSARSSPSMAHVCVILFVILWSPCEIGICFTLGSGNLLDESTLRGQRGPVLAAKFGRVPRNQFGEGRATGGHLARRAGSLGVACTAVVPVKP